jgi:putative ABC transport system ATP-binding protein
VQAEEEAMTASEDTREPLIELRNVCKDYVSAAGTVRALREVNLTIRRGEFVAIVGTSGSGKSTLMNILGCLDRPTHGVYTLAGLDVGDRTNDGRALVRNRLIGFIFQGFNLLSRTTALENVELPLQYRGFPARQRHERATKVLEQVGLTGRVHHTPNQLSGGQQQRVAIARALVTDPPLLLADEPTGNLDTRTSLEVLALLQKLNRENGITICLVTHEHDIAACASRVITVRDGRVVSDESTDTPSDAAAELAALPPPQEYGGGPQSLSAELDPAEALRRKLGGPVPFAVYAMMILGAAGGLATGLAYDVFVLGHVYWLIALVAAVLAQTWTGARYGRRKLGQPLTHDQRVRMAVWFTVGLALPAGIAGALSVTSLPVGTTDRFAAMSRPELAGALGVAVLAVAAVGLLQYLLLSLFTPNGGNGARGALKSAT